MNSLIICFSQLLLMYCFVLCAFVVHPKDATNVVHYGKPSLGGPFVLVNHKGHPVTDASYRGKFTLMYFGFSHCPDICPSELVKVGKVLKELGIDYWNNGLD